MATDQSVFGSPNAGASIVNELVKSYGFRQNAYGDWEWSLENIGQSFKEEPIWTTIDYLALAVPAAKWGTAAARVSRGVGIAGKALKAGRFAGRKPATMAGRFIGSLTDDATAAATEMAVRGPGRFSWLANPITTVVDEDYLRFAQEFTPEAWEVRGIAKAYARERKIAENMMQRTASDVSRLWQRSGASQAQMTRGFRFLQQGVDPGDALVVGALGDEGARAYKATWDFRNYIHEESYRLGLIGKETYEKNLKQYAPRLYEEMVELQAAKEAVGTARGAISGAGTKAAEGFQRYMRRADTAKAGLTEILDPRVASDQLGKAGMVIAKQQYAQALAGSAIARNSDEVARAALQALNSGDPRAMALYGLSGKKLEAVRRMVDATTNAGQQISDEAVAHALGWRKLDSLFEGRNLPGYVKRLPEELREKWIDPSAVRDVLGTLKWADEPSVISEIYQRMMSVFRTTKCLVGDTRILTEEGYVRIEDAFEYKDGYCDTGDDDPHIWTPFEGWDRPVKVFRESDVETVRITLRDGTVLEGTPEHPILCEGGLTPLEEIEIGDVIPAFLGGPFPTSMESISWNPWRGSVGGSSSIDFDEDLAELLGWIAGDGQISAQYKSPCHVRISIGYKDLEWSGQRLSELCDRLGIKYSLRTEKRVRDGANGPLSVFSIHNANLGRLLEALGMFDGKRKILRTPEIVFRSPKSVVAAYVRGLLETDGSVSKDGAFTFTSVSEELARSVHALLKWLGIQSTVKIAARERVTYIMGKRVHAKDVWRVGAYSRFARAKALELDLFQMPRKRSRIEARATETLRKPQPWKNRVVAIERGHAQTVYDVCRGGGTDHLFVSDGVASRNTAYNPATHARNWFGAQIFHHLATGGAPTAFPSKGWASIKALDDSYRAAREAGIVGSSFTKELNEIAEQAYKTTVKGGKESTSISFIGDALRRIIPRSGKAVDIVEAGAGKLEEVYRFTDEVWKLDAWIRNVERIKKTRPDLALDQVRGLATLQVNKFMPSFLSHSPLGDVTRQAIPFASFTFEALRVWKNALAEKPHLAFFWNHIVEATSSTIGAMSGFSQKELDGAREALPHYMNNKKMMLLPFNVDGKPQFLDFSYMIPMANLVEAENAERIFFTELIDPTTNPLISLASAAATGVDPFSQREIEPRVTERQLGIPVTQPQARKVVGLAEHMAMLFLPPLVPPGYAGVNLLEHARGQRNPRTAEPLEDGTARTIMANLFGLRAYSPDVESQVLNVLHEQKETTEKVTQAWKRWEFAIANGDTEAMGRERDRIISLKAAEGHDDPGGYFAEGVERHMPGRFASLSTRNMERILARANRLGALSPRDERVRAALMARYQQRRR